MMYHELFNCSYMYVACCHDIPKPLLNKNMIVFDCSCHQNFISHGCINAILRLLRPLRLLSITVVGIALSVDMGSSKSMKTKNCQEQATAIALLATYIYWAGRGGAVAAVVVHVAIFPAAPLATHAALLLF